MVWVGGCSVFFQGVKAVVFAVELSLSGARNLVADFVDRLSERGI